MSVNKILYEEQKNVRQWLDQSLCKWAANYANFIKNDENSFILPPSMKRLPQLIYHLRRSHFVNRFGISLDESFYQGFTLGR
jgi:protein transport protein SEC23